MDEAEIPLAIEEDENDSPELDGGDSEEEDEPVGEMLEKLVHRDVAEGHEDDIDEEGNDEAPSPVTSASSTRPSKKKKEGPPPPVYIFYDASSPAFNAKNDFEPRGGEAGKSQSFEGEVSEEHHGLPVERLHGSHSAVLQHQNCSRE